jgi:hypothetical protein
VPFKDDHPFLMLHRPLGAESFGVSRLTGRHAPGLSGAALLRCPVMAAATALGRSSCGMCPASVMISRRA